MRQIQKQMMATWSSCRTWETRGGRVEGLDKEGVTLGPKTQNKWKKQKTSKTIKRKLFFFCCCFHIQHSKNIRRVFLHQTPTSRENQLSCSCSCWSCQMFPAPIWQIAKGYSGTQQRQPSFFLVPLCTAWRHTSCSKNCVRNSLLPLYLMFGWGAMLCSRKIKHCSLLVLVFWAEKADK